MTIVTTTEAQSRLEQLIAGIAKGEEVLITNGGLPVAQVVKPRQSVLTETGAVMQTAGPQADEDDERPWRGVFAVDTPAEIYPCGKLHLPSGSQPLQPPADILWDRVTQSDERIVV